MFALVHLEQEEGYQDKGLANATQTSPSFAQQEQGIAITLPSNSMEEIVRRQRLTQNREEEALGIISKDINQTN